MRPTETTTDPLACSELVPVTKATLPLEPPAFAGALFMLMLPV